MSKIFFSGIGGSGVSAIAGFMADHGHAVIGSDRSFDDRPGHPIANMLRSRGIKIVPQDGSGIDGSLDFVVFSTAVEDSQPEVLKAKRLGVPMKTRPEYLCEIVSGFKAVAVAGTSGKSTTAGMLAFLTKELGMEPNFIGGGRVKQFRNESNPGNFLVGNSELLIMEACESDGSIVHYHPVYSIFTNLSLDHNPINDTAKMFATLGRNTEEIIVINGDDRNLDLCSFEKAIEFSIDRGSKYQAKSIEYQSFSTSFRLNEVSFRVSIPGRHNLYNALSCIALLSEMGVALTDIAEILPDFSGIERRFDVCLHNERYLVIDDYAHNPHKIAALMETTGRIRENICYIFQPHGYGPTRLMKDDYIQTFIDNLRTRDHLILLPIYYAGGTSVRNISSGDLCNGIKAAGRSVEILYERPLIFTRLKEWDNYVVFGARDESLAEFAREIALRLK